MGCVTVDDQVIAAVAGSPYPPPSDEIIEKVPASEEDVCASLDHLTEGGLLLRVKAGPDNKNSRYLLTGRAWRRCRLRRAEDETARGDAT